MSILGGLMQGGGYALQAKPKTYDAYGLAALKSAADEGKKKSKEQEQLQKQYKDVIMTSGANILPWQKERFLEMVSSNFANANLALERNDRQGALDIMTRTMVDAKTYSANHKTIQDILKSVDKSAINPKTYLKLFSTDSPDEAREMFETYGKFLGMEYDDKSGALAIQKHAKVDKQSQINAAMQGMLTQLSTQSVDGRKVLTKQATDTSRERVAQNVMNNPSVRAEFLSKAIDELENTGVDLKTFEPDMVIAKAEEMMRNEIYPMTDKAMFSILGEGSTTNIYNMPDNVQQQVTSGGSGILRLGTNGERQIPYSNSFSLGDVSFTLGGETNVLDATGTTVDKANVQKVTAGVSYPVYAFNSPITQEKIAELKEKYKILTPAEKNAIGPLINDLAESNKKISKISTAILNEQEAMVINKLMPNSVSAGIATSANAEVRGRSTDIYIINNTKSQIEAMKIAAKKQPAYSDYLTTIENTIEQMNQRIRGGAKKIPTINNQQEFDKLPKGSEFYNRNGKLMIKQ
jgi:hypothetical protein